MINWSLVYYLSEWVIRLIMLIYVPQKRSPAAARTWLVLIFLLPWPGLVLYALIGRPYLPRWRVEALARASQVLRREAADYARRTHLTRPELPAPLQDAVAMAERLGDFGILGENSFELLEDYYTTLDHIVADIEAAQDHVHLVTYIFADDRTGNRVADALMRAAGRGVRCRVLMDAVASKRGLRTLAPRLREGGVEVHAALPVGILRRARYDLRNHRKIIVIDGRLAWFGSHNIVDADFKRGLVYEELVGRVSGPVVAQLQAVFLSDWSLETGHTPAETDKLFPPLNGAGSSPAQVLPSSPAYQHENTQRLLIELLYAARQRIVMVTPYFIPDEPVLHAMGSAVLRGVEVHLVVPKAADQFFVCHAQRWYYRELLEAGVNIHEYRPAFLHAKLATIDGSIAMIGSSNIDIRSFLLDAEVSVLIYDPQVVERLETIEQRYFDSSNRVTLEQWARRPLGVRLLQNTARLVDALL